MKLTSKSFLIISLLLCFFFSFSMEQSDNLASLTAKFNGSTWNCTQVGVSVANVSSKNWLQVHAQNPPTSGKIENVYISISPFNGVGIYAYGNKAEMSSLKISYQNTYYNSNPKLGGGGSGTIKIIEYVKSPSPGKPGKVTGEFNGTIKSGSNTLTITNGKFLSTMVF